MKKIFLTLFLFFLIMQAMVLSPGCANIIPPTGGDKDTLPPILVSVSPAMGAKQFKAKTITFTFDEYVELQNPQENLIVSPTPEIFPRVDSKLRTVTVKILDTLEPNTTYSYDFGKSIKDINEGNVLQNFNYVFTTGDIIDTLELTGKVFLAETGGVDSTIIVMLHRNGEDSAVINEKPRYITTLDSSGNFRFKHLAAGLYYVYALKDESRSRRYQSENLLFGFAESPVYIEPNLAPVIISAYVEKNEPATSSPLTFNRAANSRSDEERLRYSTNLSAGRQDLTKNLTITFQHPLKNFDTTLLQLSVDSSFIPDKNYTLEIDSLSKTFTLKKNWVPGTLYNLIIPEEFAEDTLGNKLKKTDTLRINTLKVSDYGSLRINFSNADTSKNPVLLFYLGTQFMNSYPLRSSVFYQQLFLPGEYDLRILFDDNKNGKWDPGEFFEKRKQPEIVKQIKNKIIVRVNMDNEFDQLVPDK